MEKISKIISRAVMNKLEQFENDIITNYKITEHIDKKCSYNNVNCRMNVLDELNYGIEYKLIDDVISDLEDKPFYYFYEIYADPACPQVFKQLSADDFFFFSCYVHGMLMTGNGSREGLYKVCKEMYEKDFAHFIRVIRDYGLKNN